MAPGRSETTVCETSPHTGFVARFPCPFGLSQYHVFLHQTVTPVGPPKLQDTEVDEYLSLADKPWITRREPVEYPEPAEYRFHG